MNRRGFLKLAGSGLMVAAAPAIALAEPVRRFWQVGRGAPVGDADPFADTGLFAINAEGYESYDEWKSRTQGSWNDSVKLYPVDAPPVTYVADSRIPRGDGLWWPESLERLPRTLAGKLQLFEDLHEAGAFDGPGVKQAAIELLTGGK